MPLLPPLIELGRIDSDETRQILETYLTPLMEQGIDTFLLGCAHFPFVVELIRDVWAGRQDNGSNGDLVRSENRSDGHEPSAGGIADRGTPVYREPLETFQRVGSMLWDGPSLAWKIAREGRWKALLFGREICTILT